MNAYIPAGIAVYPGTTCLRGRWDGQAINGGRGAEGSSAPVSLLARADETCCKDRSPRSPSSPAHVSVHACALPAPHTCTSRGLGGAWRSTAPWSARGSRAPPGLSSCSEEMLLADCITIYQTNISYTRSFSELRWPIRR